MLNFGLNFVEQPVMNSALAPYIEQLLFTNDTVAVPGLGAFVAQPVSSTIDYAGGKITPPSKTLSFNENLTADDGLLTYAIVNERHISDAEARHWIDEQVTQMLHFLNQREIVAMQGIGRLYKNSLQRIQFLPDAANFSRENFGLPPIQFSPLSRSREVTEPGETPKTPVAPSQPQVTTPPPVVPSPPLAFEPSKSGSIQWSRVLLTVGLLALSGYIGYWFLQRQKNKQKEVIELPVENPENVTNDAPPADNSATATEPEKQEEKPVVKEQPAKAEKAKASKECIAIIGLFKDPTNIARLKSKLQNNGYEVYSVAGKGGAETIGAKFNYTSELEYEARLTRIRQITGESNLRIKKK